MKRPTFVAAAGVALVLAIVAAVAFGLFSTVLAAGPMLRLLISGLGFLYLGWLLYGSRPRAGRATAVAAWLALSVSSWLLAPSLPVYLFAHVALLWLIRSLLRYRSTLPALLDLCISVLSVAAAAWAAGRSGSVFLTSWTFFLVQAAAMAIPPRLISGRPSPGGAANAAFEHARRRAETAFRELMTRGEYGS